MMTELKIFFSSTIVTAGGTIPDSKRNFKKTPNRCCLAYKPAVGSVSAILLDEEFSHPIKTLLL